MLNVLKDERRLARAAAKSDQMARWESALKVSMTKFSEHPLVQILAT